jgi:glutathione S-transferase
VPANPQVNSVPSVAAVFERRASHKEIADMLTVFGEGRGFRVVWLLEEMGLPYRLRPVDLLAGVEKDAEFLAVNPAGFIPAIQDGDVTIVESIAIMEYLMARYGPTPLAPEPTAPAFPAYQQFLHLGEAGLAAPIYFVVVSRNFEPEAEQQNWCARKALEVFESRLGLVTRQLARSPYLAGEQFTAADISVTYALEFAQRTGAAALGKTEQAYVARTTGREAYMRAMDACQATKAWAATASVSRHSRQ